MLPKLDERGYAGLADMVGSRAAAGMLDSSDAAEEASEILEEAQYTPGIEPADIPQEVLEELMPGDEVVVLPRVELAHKPFYDFAKRTFDFVACSLALILLAIPMAVIACKVKLDSPGPAIYAQRRVGRGGRVFEMYKFRSMYLDAEANGARWAVGDDPRVTPFGRFMRRTRLDELPQFWNVVKGDIPLRILKTRPEFSEKSMGAFALPAKSSTNKGKAFSQVVSCFANGLRMRRISKFNCNRIRGMEAQFLAKPVFGAVCA